MSYYSVSSSYESAYKRSITCNGETHRELPLTTFNNNMSDTVHPSINKSAYSGPRGIHVTARASYPDDPCHLVIWVIVP